MRERTAVPGARPIRSCALAGAILASIAVLVGCGSASDPSGSDVRRGGYERLAAKAPPPLAALIEERSALLGGGEPSFEARLERLRGHPVVINKWASWCGPCRAEFPFFASQARRHGDRVAFLGVNSNDSDDAARTFLRDLPVPYPSYSDPESKIASELGVEIEFPATVFLNSAGETTYTQRGGYASEEELAADIERYALDRQGSG